jgi:hypothetical protein
MAFSVKFLPEVKTDLTEAKKYYFKKGGNPLSEDFKAEINSEIEYIRKFPEHYQVQYQNKASFGYKISLCNFLSNFRKYINYFRSSSYKSGV